MRRHKNKITCLYYRLPYTYALSEILSTQATEHFNHLSYVLNKFLPLDDRSTTWPTLDFGQPAHLSMLLLILTKDLKRASASYLALWATLMVDCVVLSLYWSLALLSPQSLVTWISTSFSTSSWLQPLQVAFTFPSNCSAKMLRQKPSLGCLHIWQFFYAILY